MGFMAEVGAVFFTEHAPSSEAASPFLRFFVPI
jgi:hypothetical protein